MVIATNAIGQGVNNLNVRTMFYIRPLALLRNFVQESRQAGRDGRSGNRSIILIKKVRLPTGDLIAVKRR